MNRIMNQKRPGSSPAANPYMGKNCCNKSLTNSGSIVAGLNDAQTNFRSKSFLSRS